MLSYFRINDPYRLLGLLVVMLIIYIPLFIDSPAMTFPELKAILVGEKVHEGHALYTELIDPIGPLAGWFNGLIDVLFGRSLFARHILAFIVILTQAAYIGIVFANKKAFAENSYIPSLIFAIIFVFSFDTLSLTPELLGAGFLLSALNNLFNEMEFREQKDESIFNLGLFISLASLFSFSYSVFFFGALATLMAFTRSSPRKYFLLTFGFLLPHFFLVSSYFLMDGLPDLWNYYYLPNLSFESTKYITFSSLWTLTALPVIFLVVSFFMLNRDARLSKYQTQLVQSMFFWAIFSFLQILYAKDFRPQNFITLIPSISFFGTHFLLLIRKRRIAEIIIWVLLIGCVSVSYLARYNVLSGVNYASLFVPNKIGTDPGKTMLVLDDDWGVYKNNKFASPFLDWRLSQEIFSQPQYYENVIAVYDGIRTNPPDVIRDRNDLMKPFFDRLPELKKVYVRNGEYYQKR